jgi:hypothetical protein
MPFFSTCQRSAAVGRWRGSLLSSPAPSPPAACLTLTFMMAGESSPYPGRLLSLFLARPTPHLWSHTGVENESGFLLHTCPRWNITISQVLSPSPRTSRDAAALSSHPWSPFCPPGVHTRARTCRQSGRGFLNVIYEDHETDDGTRGQMQTRLRRHGLRESAGDSESRRPDRAPAGQRTAVYAGGSARGRPKRG